MSIITTHLFGINIKKQNSALDKNNPHICIGWGNLGNLSNIKERDELELLFDNVTPNKSKKSKVNQVGQIFRFVKETNVGDFVVFRSNKIIHIGKITSDYYFNDGISNQDSEYANNREVEWLLHISQEVLSEGAFNSLGCSMSYFNLDKYIDEFNTLLDGKYLEKIPEFKLMKEESEIDPEQYDGSYAFINKVAESYKDSEINSLNYSDLELFYFSIIGTWKSSYDDKKNKIQASNLPENKKIELKIFLDELHKKTDNGSYDLSKNKKKKYMGMFGTGKGTFKDVNENDVCKLLKMFIEINSNDDEETILNLVKEPLSNRIKGIKTGVLTPILHCLKPKIFPIINGNQGQGVSLYEKLGIIIENPFEIESYYKNTINIRDFRNKNFSFKNYRIFDVYSKDNNSLIEGYKNDEGIFTCDTNLNSDDWKRILLDKELVDDDSLDLIKAWYEKENHEASCSEIADLLDNEKYKNGKSINGKITSTCKKICENQKILIDDSGQNRYFPVMMNGRYSTYNANKVYNWILRPEIVEALEGLKSIEECNKPVEFNKIYSKEYFLNDVYITEEKYNEIKNVLQRRKNIILQGSPGVGKTYMAERLAFSIINEKNKNRIEIIQFHQSYSYEDFIYGYQPTDTTFKLKPGIFYNFCKKAEKDNGNPYFFIIDEINRGNLSKIFGELLMLIESDKRGKSLILSHTKEAFTVPQNVYIIGMMNTADRSLAIVDYALRRRFSIIKVEPAFSHPNFKKDLLKNGTSNDIANKIINKFNKLNNEILNDSSLGEGFIIGHSYFCINDAITNEVYKEIIKYDIKPILDEYWFDDMNKVEQKVKELLD